MDADVLLKQVEDALEAHKPCPACGAEWNMDLEREPHIFGFWLEHLTDCTYVATRESYAENGIER